MGKIIKVIFPNPTEWERKQNIKQLKILIQQYVKNDNGFTLKKIKDEQRTEI